MYSGKKNRRILMLVSVLARLQSCCYSFTKTQLKRRMKHRRLRHENRSVRYKEQMFRFTYIQRSWSVLCTCQNANKPPLQSTYQQSSITTTVVQCAYAQRVFGSCYYIGTGITYRSFYLFLSMS